MSKSLIWKLAPSDGSTKQPRGRMPIELADPLPESANQPTPFRTRTNTMGVPKREAQLELGLPSPVKIFTAQRNRNATSPGAAATKVAAAQAQWKPEKKMKKLSEIGVPEMEPDQRREDEKDSKSIREEVVGSLGKRKTPVAVVGKHKVPVEGKPEKPRRVRRRPHFKIKKISEIGVPKVYPGGTDQSTHQAPDQRRDEEDAGSIMEDPGETSCGGGEGTCGGEA